jgi:hypothetical protein
LFLLLRYIFYFINDLNYQNISLDQLNSDRKNSKKVMKYNKKNLNLGGS